MAEAGKVETKEGATAVEVEMWAGVMELARAAAAMEAVGSGWAVLGAMVATKVLVTEVLEAERAAKKAQAATARAAAELVVAATEAMVGTVKGIRAMAEEEGMVLETAEGQEAEREAVKSVVADYTVGS